ncbi:MAG: tetratricopeptide repeat protein, partial [Burkholderiales bacterium]
SAAPAAAAPAPSPASAAPRHSRPDVVRAAEAFREAIALYRAGSLELAIFAIDSGLAVNPSDLQLRFLKAVILSEQGRRSEARRLFEALTQEFPEAPEPHNNLAVIYASIGELDLARNSLEAALKAAPDYAVARENLGDVYLRLAAREFERAAKTPSQAASATRRMELTRELINRLASPEPSVPAPRGSGSSGSSPAGGTSDRSSNGAPTR